jgi:L-alanine-DL-glutamate epimerase-like enolase superfamily enzyme
MKITDVQAIVLDCGRDYAVPDGASEASGVRFVCLIRIDTDAGIVGWSDVETQPHVAHQIVNVPRGGGAGFESLQTALVGENPFERERLWQKMYRTFAYFGRQGAGMQVLSGADIALWDIAGKAQKLPVCELLGAKYRDKVKAYASTLFRNKPDDMKRAVADYVKQGFRAIKFGWGTFGYDLELDVALVRAARQEAGDKVELLVDPGWYEPFDLAKPSKQRSIKDWIKLVYALEELNVTWLEDFLHPDNLDGYAEVSKHTKRLRLAAGEQYAGIHEFERLARVGRIDVLQPDLSRCGGLTVARQIADLAMRMQIDCAPHAWLTDVLTAASLHLNAYLINSLFLEFNVSTSGPLRKLGVTPIEMRDGYVNVPTGPGLGVEVDEAAVKKYRVL